MRNASGAASATFLEARLGHGAQHMGGAEGAPRHAATEAAAPGSKQLERADRRQPSPAGAILRPNDVTDASTLATLRRHPRPERDLVQRHAVAAHRGLGLGGADNVVPGVSGSGCPRAFSRTNS